MKKATLFLLCFLLLSCISRGQSFRQKPDLFFLYANLGAGVPTGTGFVGADLVTKQGWSASVSFANSTRNSPNTPSDYYNSFTLFGNGPTRTVNEEIAVWRFAVGKVWWLSPMSRVRLHLKTGIGIGHFSTPENFVPTAAGPFQFSNYDYTRVEKPATGFVTHAGFELPVSRFFGFTVGIGVNLNKHWNVFNLTMAINPGYFSGRRPPRK